MGLLGLWSSFWFPSAKIAPQKEMYWACIVRHKYIRSWSAPGFRCLFCFITKIMPQKEMYVDHCIFAHHNYICSRSAPVYLFGCLGLRCIVRHCALCSGFTLIVQLLSLDVVVLCTITMLPDFRRAYTALYCSLERWIQWQSALCCVRK